MLLLCKDLGFSLAQTLLNLLLEHCLLVSLVLTLLLDGVARLYLDDLLLFLDRLEVVAQHLVDVGDA